jgi:neutral ceramidase
VRVKKAARVAARIIFGLLLLISIAAVFCLDSVDYRPYFRQPYYRATIARLQSAAQTNTLARGELSAGFGRAKLTPTIPLPLAGFGNRHGKLATGVHDDIFVKAVAVRVADRVGIMFGCDALIVPREIADQSAARIATELKLKRDQLYFSATHTHCSLGGWGEGRVGEAFAGKFDPRSREIFVGAIVAAAVEAIKDLKPGEFGHGSFVAREFIRNRLVGDLGKVDPEFSYAIFKQTNGRTGIIGSFSAHATVLGGSVMEYSADYPGQWQRAMEEATGGVAVFLASGVGSQGPVGGESGFVGTERMGQGLAAMLLKQLPQTRLTNSISFGMLSVDVAMPELNERISDNVRLRPWVAKQLLPPTHDSFVQAFRLDDSIWISTPCDYSGELALGIKDTLHARGFAGVITSFNGDYIGYVIPSRYYHLSGYEPRIMSFYGPYVPDYLDELARTIALDLTGLN